MPPKLAAHRLMLNGSIALAEAEAQGIRINRKRLKASIEECQEIETKLLKTLKTDQHGDVWGRMRKRYGQSAKLTSGQQLGTILFKDLGFPVVNRTKTGKPKTDEDSLSEIPLPWVREWGHLMKIKKVHGTYLKGIARETQVHRDVVTGIELALLHPVFNLHTTNTYRSSCSDPNFQNMPVRNPVYARYIRDCIIPRPGRRIIEIDFGGAEVRVAACYHRDPRMLEYLATNADWHSEMAGECFFLPSKEVPKKLRNTAKGMFTFAEFYGDWWWSVARNLWDSVSREKLATNDGISIIKHLKKNGITDLGLFVPDDKNPDATPEPGTFQHHIMQLENHLWKERFPVYDRWRRDFYAQYKTRGWFNTHTGFYVEGVFRRNEVINNPVQGSSFHCLLWAFNRLTVLIRKRGLRIALVGQIHDSIVADGDERDIPEFLALAKQVIEVELKKQFPWLITGMIAEAKISDTAENGGSWFKMEESPL